MIEGENGKAQYDKFAPKYISARNAHESGPREVWGREQVRNFLRSLKDQTLVEGGCGHGPDIDMFLELDAAKIVGFDQSDALIEEARRQTSDARVTLYTAGYEQIPLPDKSADVFVAMMSLHYLPDIDVAYKEIARILKPGGRYAFLVPHPEKMVQHSGLTFVAGTKKREVRRSLYGGKVAEVRYPAHRLRDYLSEYYSDHFTNEALSEFHDPDPNDDKTALLFYAGKRNNVEV